MATRKQVLTKKYDELKDYCKQHAPDLLTLFPEKVDLSDLLFTLHCTFNGSFERGDYTLPLKRAVKLYGVKFDVTPHVPFLNEQIHFFLTFMKTQK